MIITRAQQSIPDLVVQAQQGDSQAIGELYENYRLCVYRYLYYRTSDSHVADDLTSEVFLRMIRSLNSFRWKSVSFQAWLLQIAHNLLADHYRKMSYRNDVQLEDFPMQLRDSQNVEQSLNSVTLQQALNRLNGEQRDVIVMRFITGMPISDVAQALNKSEDAIKGLQRRGLAALKDVLSEWEVKYV